DVYFGVGKPGAVNYADLVRYPLSLPGVATAIIGIGQINREKPEADQLVANLAAALKDMPSAQERARIERETQTLHGPGANYFQEKATTLTQPTGVKVERDADRLIVRWNTAYAGSDPIRFYEIRAGNRTVLSIPYRPQLTEAPLSAVIPASAAGDGPVTVVAV
ncbi:MAG: hypothetical protein K6T59_09165, partial [Bryobacteraceae bacterium]|nr:hypothetical protein [Bryobacteraceae bacterium]